MGPAIMLALFITTLFLGSPIIFGAVIAQLLLSRRQRWWIFAPRYVAAWFATFMTLGMIGAVIGGSDRNLLMIGMPALVAFLIIRRWRKPKSPKNEPASDAA